ncbi:uncharacterized protein LOC122567528 isoform X2 [Bombus pyrosoma]|uniref:uncharacterized protein LOC122567528 isoform X2 n=1 Tax=Bombus pyrosoma TaxID=396416 RepID=UPI001CB9D3B5|nr:uncharacterized protein LOC122567528 isoform X2 [Bombus pyrosoma]
MFRVALVLELVHLSKGQRTSAGAQEYISQIELLYLLWECSNSGSKAKNIFHNLHFHHWIFNGSCLMLVFLMIFAERVQYRWFSASLLLMITGHDIELEV